MTGLRSSAIEKTLSSLSCAIRPWATCEDEMSSAINCDVFLGGDGLRPYAVWREEGTVQLIAYDAPDLPRPPLVDSIIEHHFGVATVQGSGSELEFIHISLPESEEIDLRLKVPRVLLVGLGDSERYRGARLSLGIARLAQWLRFTHAASVTVVDYNQHDLPLEHVKSILSSSRYDIIGVSVNFGQWGMLADLAGIVNEFGPEIVVLGNILAAYSPVEATSMFTAARTGNVFVATSLGEKPFEELCRTFENLASGRSIPGLLRPQDPNWVALDGEPSMLTRVEPPALVFPDDQLVLDIANAGGQISFETSFGCQYGVCTFCPRDHRGEGWSRGRVEVARAALRRISTTGAVLSLVDEEFFGDEGLVDPPIANFPAAQILEECRRSNISYEIYTRLEQIFDAKRSRTWNVERSKLLLREAPAMRRIFVGVESGSPRQLRRYGKGQTVEQTVDALRVGSALGVPMEFGFITFDPLTTADELVENILFLARRDIMAAGAQLQPRERIAAVESYLDGSSFEFADVPLYRHVAYMATEMEVLAHSRYASRLRRRNPELLTGEYDAGFARFGVKYMDHRIGLIADWCRVWTEGMFTPVYEARMRSRAALSRVESEDQANLVLKYRDATFLLLSHLASRYLPSVSDRFMPFVPQFDFDGDDPMVWLEQLASTVLADGAKVSFKLEFLDSRRDA